MKKTIGLVVAQPPIYTETFLMSKIQNLIDDGFEVVIFSNLNRANNTQAPVYSSYTELSILKLMYNIPYIVFKIIQNFNTISKYKKYINTQYSSTVSKYKNIYSNLHILFNPVNHLHFEFSVLAADKEYVAKSMGAKMTVSFRGYDVSISILKNKGLFNTVWQNIDGVHTISNDLVKRALKHGMNPTTPVTKIEPAIDLTSFKPAQITWGDTLNITTTGRVSWKKGYQYVFAALTLLRKQNINFQYHVIGGFEEPEKEEFLFLAQHHQLQNDIIFHDKMNREEVNSILDKTHIYIQYSSQEGFCNATIEAQAKGLLTIVSDAGGLPENVVNDKTGWVLPKRNPVILASKIVEIYNMSNEKKKEFSENAMKHVSQNFDIRKQQDLFREFFNQAS